MPAFMWASGFIYILTLRREPYMRHVARKFKRLALPYLVVSLIILAIKYFTQRVMYVENPVSAKDLISIFYLPSAGYFLWFLWSLFTIFIIVPWIKTPRQRVVALIISALLAQVAPYVPEVLCLRQTVRFLPYFLFGSVCADYLHLIRAHAPRSQWPLIGGGIVLFGIVVTTYFMIPPLPVTELLCGISGIGGIVLVCEFIRRRNMLVAMLLIVAEASFTIYLFHTTIEGLCKAMLAKLPLTMSAYVITAIVVALGIAIPMLLHYNLFNRYSITRTIFGIRVPNLTHR